MSTQDPNIIIQRFWSERPHPSYDFNDLVLEFEALVGTKLLTHLKGKTMSTQDPNIIIQRFWEVGCPNCMSMKRAKTLENWASQHPNIKVEEYDLANDEANDLADEYDIKAIPAFVFLDSDKTMVLRKEGAMSAMGLEKEYQKALKNIENGDYGAQPRKKKGKK